MSVTPVLFQGEVLMIYLKDCWFFIVFDLQSGNFMWFKFIFYEGTHPS